MRGASLAKAIIPNKMAYQAWRLYRRLQYKATDVRYVTAYTNVYDCCVHLSCRQWIRDLLSAIRLYQY